MGTDYDQLPTDQQPAIRVVAMPADTNSSGDIFGGWIMSQVDIAGSVVASRRAQGRVATVAVNEFIFHKPVFVGDLISCYAKVVRVGTTSLTIDVSVFSERDKQKLVCVQVTEATLTYVAIDNNRKPRSVPSESAS